ncbi:MULTISPECIES: efflux RND transporter periplasmic adaptor subunit [unclassified Agarivorans]|uniref:efflux RND transporter periplasmic adaptor subunit n=1 Tax=unclassified Agarivorans TaxID=2636026 RepID=UPI0026E13945|nr:MULTISPECIES: efflux RND transporter periplasmic adaptor subunit [unclassified Agarivorans]MDO6686753.1 efflux RND transporter periplasmic adaptor subunit [Agarivorans sp. 3_MG-2023]MDO6716517.1 efflux RND transporter periplasmic adaptor subunit [Agarivorans sp. 2_MG-2023]
MASVFDLTKIIAISALSISLIGCGKPEAATQQTPPPPSVDVAEVLLEQITETDFYTGRLQAPQTVMVVPRVSGYIDQVLFNEGSVVTKGEVLFKIDNRIFAAEVERLEAELVSAKSSLDLAKKGYKRAQALNKKNAISDEILDSRFSAREQGAAAVASITAALSRARLDLDFTEVRAPIAGRVSNALITEGNYVNLGSSQLTRIVSIQHMYAYFDVDEQSFLKYQELNNVIPLSDSQDSIAAVQMALADDSVFKHLGKIDFIDNALTGATGTIRLRARFNNQTGELRPGMFARLQIAGSSRYQAVLIDNKAVGTDLNNKFVLVLDDNDQVQYRPVVLGEQINGLRIVSQGLSGSERIVVNGIQRVRPQMQVTPVPASMASDEVISELRQSQRLLEQQHQQLSLNAKLSAQQG